MHTNPAQHNRIWLDKFSEPTIEQLIEATTTETKPHIETMRAFLCQKNNLNESLEWKGLPWRWSMVYRLRGRRVSREPIAYLIASPSMPSVVFRIDQAQLDTLPIKKINRLVREGIASCPLVAGVCWPQWPLQSQTQTDELMRLFTMIRNTESDPSS